MLRAIVDSSVASVGRVGARVLLLVSALNFGLLAALTRIATRSGFSAGQAALVRFGVGALLSLGIFAARTGAWSPVRKGLLVARAILGGLAAFLYFVALSHTSAVEATLLNSTFPILATALAFFVLRERPTLHLLLGIAVVSLGVFLVLDGGVARFTLAGGELAGMASALFAAGAVLVIRKLRATDNALTIFFAFCLGGLLVSLPFAGGPWPTGAALWLLAVIGIGGTSFLAQILMTHAYGKLTVPEASIWQQLTPVASYLWALLLLGETLSSLGLLGVAIGVLGVAYGSAFGSKRPASDTTASSAAEAE